jgi:hypothetical protein
MSWVISSRKVPVIRGGVVVEALVMEATAGCCADVLR